MLRHAQPLMSSENTPDLLQKASETTVISTHPSHYSTFFHLSSPNVLEQMKTHGWIKVFWSLTPFLSWAWIYSPYPCLYKETVQSITFSCNLPLCCKVKPAKGTWNIARSCQTPACIVLPVHVGATCPFCSRELRLGQHQMGWCLVTLAQAGK